MKFYELSRSARLAQLVTQGCLTATSATYLTEKPALADEVLTAITENDLGQFVLPYAVADHFLIDGQRYLVPMVTEEPSVVAAASNGAQRIAAGGGFKTVTVSHQLKAQVLLTGITDFATLNQRIQAQAQQLQAVAAAAHPSIVRRGGGLRELALSEKGQGTASLDLWIDPQAAFGANLANTIAEAVAGFLQSSILQGDEQVLAAILSNSGARMIAQIQAQVPYERLATAQLTGATVAAKIVALNQFAQRDADRASTENKGVLNGIFAVTLATGNDLRAVSAAITDQLQRQSQLTLATWQDHPADERLLGELTIALPVGRVGGAINSLPAAKISLELLGEPQVTTLMSIIASAGLANNLAALRSLVTSGIQAGHMRLQAANLAIQAGAQGAEIATLTQQLNAQAKPDLARAQALLTIIRAQKKES
ncbi:3-hydroxy-3-methylglutaryl-CoA reductase [Lapidilactobacillus luobeiensis]|uniref:3-hydroxy-3-methylglutaryl-CoA reductase n=1 Tax=Lapidilactobacillus luobeiensis TaxID=2950371 RepID=UPI0021C280FC|nr:3-hydroxy-3-methylglutaryl-CoA reductase [Lapidilactobacillus luobeiensis]